MGKSLQLSRPVSEKGLLFGVIGAAHQRAGEDIGKAQLQADLAQAAELVRVIEFFNFQVPAGRAQILTNGY